MSLRDTLKKGLVTVAAVAALSMPATGCVQGSRYQTSAKRPNETMESYVIEYDVLSEQTARHLFVAEHNRMPNEDELDKYRKVDVDVNGNGILDYRVEMTIYKVDNVPKIKYLKMTYRSITDKDTVSEEWAQINPDGTATITMKTTAPFPGPDDRFHKHVSEKVSVIKDIQGNVESASAAYKRHMRKVTNPK